jgi:hypothetical protein
MNMRDQAFVCAAVAPKCPKKRASLVVQHDDRLVSATLGYIYFGARFF